MMDLTGALLLLKNAEITAGIFTGDEDWIIGSIPVASALSSELASYSGDSDKFVIQPTDRGWSLVVMGPAMIHVAVLTDDALDPLMQRVLNFYSHDLEDEPTSSAMEQSEVVLKASNLVVGISGGPTKTLFGGTHVVGEGPGQVFANMFAIFLHATAWIGIRIMPDRTASLIAFAHNLGDVVRAVIEHYGAVPR